jgi:LacI family transcriptional regulator
MASFSTSNPPSTPTRPLVALVGFAMSGLDADILLGIQEYAHTHNWQIFNANSPWGMEQIEGNAALVSGVLAVVADEERAAWLKKLKRPVVNVSNTFPEKFGFPTVVSNDTRVGELAFEHFLERGYRNFAVYLLPGEHPYRYISTRASAFAQAVEKQGFLCHGILDMYPGDNAEPFIKAGWRMLTLRELPKPCGIFCIDDQQGSMISFLTLSRGLSIPSEIGVLGSDNFELYCNMSNPPLSSVELNGKQIGFTAAETLQHLMPLGKPAPYELITVPPKEVVSRATVDTSAIQEPVLARARQYILEHSHERINVSDVVRVSGTSRRKLEMLYREHFNETPLEALNRARVARSLRLLRDSALPLHAIADLSGFRDTHQMNRVFLRSGNPPPRRVRSDPS